MTLVGRECYLRASRTKCSLKGLVGGKCIAMDIELQNQAFFSLSLSVCLSLSLSQSLSLFLSLSAAASLLLSSPIFPCSLILLLILFVSFVSFTISHTHSFLVWVYALYCMHLGSSGLFGHSSIFGLIGIQPVIIYRCTYPLTLKLTIYYISKLSIH